MGEIRLAVLLHEVDLLRLATRVHAVGAEMLLDILGSFKADVHVAYPLADGPLRLKFFRSVALRSLLILGHLFLDASKDRFIELIARPKIGLLEFLGLLDDHSGLTSRSNAA
jgi:hypothetical protein